MNNGGGLLGAAGLAMMHDGEPIILLSRFKKIFGDKWEDEMKNYGIIITINQPPRPFNEAEAEEIRKFIRELPNVQSNESADTKASKEK